MIGLLSIMCHVPPAVEILGPTTIQFSNPDPRVHDPLISNQIDAAVDEISATNLSVVIPVPRLDKGGRERKCFTVSYNSNLHTFI